MWTISAISSSACVGAQTKTDERDVGMLARSHRADLLDVDLAGDHLVTESCHDLGEQLQPVPPLVGDQHAEGRDLRIAQRLRSKCQKVDSSAGGPVDHAR